LILILEKKSKPYYLNSKMNHTIKVNPLKDSTELHYIKLFHPGVQYRAVYDIDKKGKEVLVAFLGSRENFYKELRRFIR